MSTRYFMWGPCLPTEHEMIDAFARHGQVVKVILFDGPDGYFRGTAEICPSEIKNPEADHDDLTNGD
jgi:hypothetical protein